MDDRADGWRFRVEMLFRRGYLRVVIATGE